ncbi:co-chaperone DjlA [Cellvibrio sp. NN19]|uniref:co-chaperone DjlA n=1 Tax=Cellvibrio chitinivorans TaxID=3102792 RepID=UPI002B40B8C2|nr:co-chaperone DjlA [Cellvibrio sp. NN19]
MPDKRQSIRDAFLTAAFRFLGYVAHCDGAINRSEINRLKVHMKKMNLAEDEQRKALQLFKSATIPGFNAREALKEFRAATTPKLIQILLVHLIAMARSDGYLMQKELHAIQWIARELGYKSIAFSHMLKMIYAQDQIALRRNPPKPVADTYSASGNSYNTSSTHHANNNTNDSAYDAAASQDQDLHKAYKILGVSVGMTEDEIRRAYKKLASQLHPDKLMSQGLPQEQLNAALDNFKRIQAAYSFIKKHRSLYAAN